MERFEKLDRFQKGILIGLVILAVVFAAIYFVVISRVGYRHKDTLLIPVEENGMTVYSGKINGQPAAFTVSKDHSVLFQYGEKIYGPYTAKMDPTAVPEKDNLSGSMTGVEVCKGEEVVFRGGVIRTGGEDGYLMLFDEDGTLSDSMVSVYVSNGEMYDSEGNLIDQMEPSVSTILDLMNGPKLTHKGHWIFWFLCVFASALTAVSILFADEIFRWNLRYQIRNADLAEPSDWELSSRYLTWVVMPVVIFIGYMMGLR